MASTPVILSPALPSGLLTYIIQQETYPTTLIICSSRADFLDYLISDVQDTTRRPVKSGTEPRDVSSTADSRPHALLTAPLYQVAVARHIRMAFVPTVSHLRAYLSVFTSKDSNILPPPTTLPSSSTKKQSLLLVYGFLNLHRDTSEWSAQGISSTAASLVEAARKTGFRAVVVDHPQPSGQSADGGDDETAEAGVSLLLEEVSVLSASTRRTGADLDDSAWTGRKVTVGRVLARWFRHEKGNWGMKAPQEALGK